MSPQEGPTGDKVYLLPVVRGLETAREQVRSAFAESLAEAVGLSISDEELEALNKYDRGDVPPSNFEEDIYIEGLSQFGDVKKPPPCFLEARDIARRNGLRCYALDMNDRDYTEAYVGNVSTMELMRHSLKEGKLRRWRSEARTPEAFVLEFDRMVNDGKGLRRLELDRERHMAKRIAELARKHAPFLAVVEYERAAGVRKLLDDYRLMY